MKRIKELDPLNDAWQQWSRTRQVSVCLPSIFASHNLPSLSSR